LSDKNLNGRVNVKPLWNFHKYLVNREGEVVDYFYSVTNPQANRLITKIEKLITAKCIHNHFCTFAKFSLNAYFWSKQKDTMKLDLMVMTVHPDDAELGAGGTIAKYVAAGKKVGIIDLTQGELGTRGTAETRQQEATRAADILGVQVRENLGLRDGFFTNDEESQLVIIRAIRKYQPE